MRFSGTKQLFKITLLARFEPEFQFTQSYSGAQTASPPPQLPRPPPPLLPPLVCGTQDVMLASQTLWPKPLQPVLFTPRKVLTNSSGWWWPCSGSTVRLQLMILPLQLRKPLGVQAHVTRPSSEPKLLPVVPLYADLWCYILSYKRIVILVADNCKKCNYV